MVEVAVEVLMTKNSGSGMTVAGVSSLPVAGLPLFPGYAVATLGSKGPKGAAADRVQGIVMVQLPPGGMLPWTMRFKLEVLPLFVTGPKSAIGGALKAT